MTQLQTMSDQELNRKLAELMGYTIKELPIGPNGRQLYALVTPIGRQRMASLTIHNAYLDAPDYCTDPAASLEVQAAACEVDEEAYTGNLQTAKGWESMRMLKEKYAARLCNATPRERAEAAYMTLQVGK